MFKFKSRLIFLSRIKSNLQKRITVFVERRPLTSFILALSFLLGLILLGNVFKTPVKEISQTEIVKEVNVLTLGQFSKAKISGQVEKQGVLEIHAQSSGVVSGISVREGDQVKKGKNLVSLASNYQGGNAPSLSRQMAQKQFQNTKDNFDTQKEIIGKQREVAEKSATNTEELRKITELSNKDTVSLLGLNQDILSSVNANLDSLVASNVGGVNDALILQTKQSRSTLQSAINSLNSSIRSSDYSTNINNPPSELANINKEITLKQLEIQEKALILSKETSQIQLNLAFVTEGLMFPVSPCSGVVQKVHVIKGELVNPGNPLITVSCEGRSIKVVAKVPSHIAKQASLLMESQLIIDGIYLNLLPDFISSEATDGQLYQIIYSLPDLDITGGQYINIELPLGQLNSGAQFFIPLESIFQTEEGAFVYIEDSGKAISKKVTLGQVIGSDVEVIEGLKQDNRVILDRSVIAGDRVRVKN